MSATHRLLVFNGDFDGSPTAERARAESDQIQIHSTLAALFTALVSPYAGTCPFSLHLSFIVSVEPIATAWAASALVVRIPRHQSLPANDHWPS